MTYYTPFFLALQYILDPDKKIPKASAFGIFCIRAIKKMLSLVLRIILKIIFYNFLRQKVNLYFLSFGENRNLQIFRE